MHITDLPLHPVLEDFHPPKFAASPHSLLQTNTNCVFSLEIFLLKRFHIRGPTPAAFLLAALLTTTALPRHFHQQHVPVVPSRCWSRAVYALLPWWMDVWVVLEFDWYTRAVTIVAGLLVGGFSWISSQVCGWCGLNCIRNWGTCFQSGPTLLYCPQGFTRVPAFLHGCYYVSCQCPFFW